MERFKAHIFGELPSEKLYIYFISAFLIFMGSHGINMIEPSHNFQDWLTIAGLNHTGLTEGRFFVHLMRKLLADTNIIALQVILSFLILSVLPFFLLHQDHKNLSNLLFLFGVGSTYPFWVDLLAYDGWNSTMLFALLFGVVGFSFSVTSFPQNRALRIFLGSIVVLCGTFFYPMFAFFGVIIPSIALISANNRSISNNISILLDTLYMLLLFALLYIVTIITVFYLLDIEASTRFTRGGLRFIYDQRMFDFYTRAVATHLTNISPAYYSYLQMFLFCSIPILYVFIAKQYISNKDWRIVFVSLGLVGAMFVAPFNLSLLFDINLPARARATFDFAMAASFLAVLYPAIATFPQRATNAIIKMQQPKILILLTSVFVFSGAVASGYLWNLSEYHHRRDIAKAVAIYSEFVNITQSEALDSNKMVIVGMAHPEKAKAFYSIKSTFIKPWGAKAIMEATYDLDVTSFSARNFEGTCSGFPMKNSVFIRDRIVHVCLQDIE